jgi:hypothetical protein
MAVVDDLEAKQMIFPADRRPDVLLLRPPAPRRRDIRFGSGGGGIVGSGTGRLDDCDGRRNGDEQTTTV